MSNYARGFRFEHRIREVLEAAGCLVVRSAGSHTAVDLIAVREAAPTLFVQCKAGKKGISPAEWNELFELAVRYKALPLAAIRPSPKTYEFRRLMARKDDGRREQPWERWEL